MRRTFLGLALASVLVLATTEARAQAAPPDTVHAKEAYDRGVAAHERGDLARAAREFATADRLAPSAVALQAALEAAVDADDPVTGGELLERTKRLAAPVNPKLSQSIEAARKKLGGRAGRVHVTCPPGSTCTATLDGKSFDTKSAIWVATGPHTVVVQLDDETQTKAVDVKADELVDVAPVRKPAVSPLPAAPPPVPQATGDAVAAPVGRPKQPIDTASPSSGFPPLVFVIGLGATVLAGAGAGYFMVTTKSTHDDFVAAGCDAGPAASCQSLKDDGDTSQLRANVAIAATAVFAVATVVIGVAFTDWSRGLKKSAFGPQGPGAGGLSVRF